MSSFIGWLTGSNKSRDEPIVSSRITNVVDPDGVQAFLNTNQPAGTTIPFTLPDEQREGLTNGTFEMAVYPRGQLPPQLQSTAAAQSVPISMAPSGQSGGFQPYGGAQPPFFNASSAPGMSGQGQSNPSVFSQPPSFMQQSSYGGFGPTNPSMLSQPSGMQSFAGAPQHGPQQPTFPQSLGQGQTFNPSLFSQAPSNVQQFSGMPQGALPQQGQFGQSTGGFPGHAMSSASPLSQATQGAHSAWNANSQAQMGQPSSFFAQSQGTGFGGPQQPMSQFSLMPQQQPVRWGSQSSMQPQRPVSFYNSLNPSAAGGMPPFMQSAMSS